MMARHKQAWRVLSHGEKKKYAMGMRRLNLGFWGYKLKTLFALHLTTREGDDNTEKVFARDLRGLIGGFRGQGYEVEYCGALEHTPGKGLLHWHGLLRVKGGYFPVEEDEVADRWYRLHGAWQVKFKRVKTEKELRKYILKHVLAEYVGEEEGIRNKFLFSRGWMRPGWKEVEEIAKGWVLGGGSSIWMTKEGWDLVNKILKAWAEKRKVMFVGRVVDGERTGYLYMERGRIVEAEGGAFKPGDYEYIDMDHWRIG